MTREFRPVAFPIPARNYNSYLSYLHLVHVAGFPPCGTQGQRFSQWLHREHQTLWTTILSPSLTRQAQDEQLLQDLNEQLREEE